MDKESLKLFSSWNRHLDNRSRLLIEANLLEEEAILVAENAVQAGSEIDTTLPGDHVVNPPETATVTLGGKKCKWCGSTTHSRKSHKDCPQNPKNVPTST